MLLQPLPKAFANNPEEITETSNREVQAIADRELRRAIDNPEEYHRQISDITNPTGNKDNPIKVMTLDMAKFYWAVAAVEFTHCLTSNDSTRCTQYMEGLKDPIGHIGFALFMKTNHMTIDLAQVVTRKRINPGMASYLGLATGMMAQTIFQDIAYHPKVRELFRTATITDPVLRKQKRDKVLNELWIDFTQNSGKYLFNKIPNILGLLGSAYVSHKTMQALGSMFTRSSRLVKFVFDPKTARTIIRYGAGLVRQRQMIKAGIKLAWKGGRLVRVNPVVAIGSYLVETIVFLVWAPIIEEFLVKHWDRGNALLDISKAKDSLVNAIEQGKETSDIEKEVGKLAKGYDRFRESIISKAEITKMRHLIGIQQMDAKFQKMLMYYEWLIKGMDYNSDLWTLNEQEYHSSHLITSINDSVDNANSFFCGKSPDNAVEREVDVNGIPMPSSWSYDYSFDANRTYYENMRTNEGVFNTTGIVLNPFRVMTVDGLCESDIKRMNGGSMPSSYDQGMCPLRYHADTESIDWTPHRTYGLFCRVYLSQARQRVLIDGQLKGRNIRDQLADKLDEAAGKVMRKIWSQRDLMVMRFEKAVRIELATALSGKTVRLSNTDTLTLSGSVDSTSFLTGSIPLGMIAHFDYERTVWNEYMDKYTSGGPLATVLRKQLDELYKKQRAAEELLAYTLQPYSQRVRSQDFFQEIPTQDWQKVVHTLREYIVP
jgi:hypothetical protein